MLIPCHTVRLLAIPIFVTFISILIPPFQRPTFNTMNSVLYKMLASNALFTVYLCLRHIQQCKSINSLPKTAKHDKKTVLHLPMETTHSTMHAHTMRCTRTPMQSCPDNMNSRINPMYRRSRALAEIDCNQIEITPPDVETTHEPNSVYYESGNPSTQNFSYTDPNEQTRLICLCSYKLNIKPSNVTSCRRKSMAKGILETT